MSFAAFFGKLRDESLGAGDEPHPAAVKHLDGAAFMQAAKLSLSLSGTAKHPISTVYVCSGLDAFELSLDRDPLKFRKQVAYAGQFIKRDKPFALTSGMFQQWKNNADKFRENGIRIPMPIGHKTDPESNRGEVCNLELGTDSKGRDALYFVGRFCDADAAKLASTADVSLNAVENYSDANGNNYGPALTHIALTDYPVLPDLGRWEIAASYDGDYPTGRKPKIGKAMNKVVLDAMKENRTLKLDALVASGNITPACRKALELSFCDEETITLSLSHDDETGTNPDKFGKLVEALKTNLPNELRLSKDGSHASGIQDVAGAASQQKAKSPMSKAVDKINASFARN